MENKKKETIVLEYLLKKQFSLFNKTIDDIEEYPKYYKEICLSKRQFYIWFLLAVSHVRSVLKYTKDQAIDLVSRIHAKYGAVIIDKPIILCIVGESGIGKTFVAEYMEERFITMIRSYTTRKPRSDKDTSHMFISNEEFDKFNKDDMLAYLEITSDTGEVHRYCCLRQNVSTGMMSYVINYQGFLGFKEKYSDEYNIIGIRIVGDRNKHYSDLNTKRFNRDVQLFKDEDKSIYDYVLVNEYDDSILDEVDKIINEIRVEHFPEEYLKD